jgi:hypothetical protein
MRFAVTGSRIALVAAVLVGAAPPTPHTTFMFPGVVMLRGGGVTAPVVLTHAGAIGGVPGESRDTIAIVYGSLTPHRPVSPERVRRRPFIEVAEFLGVGYVVDAAGHVPASQFERANHHSRIYLPAGREPALWESPVVAPGGVHHAFYELGEPARRVLEARGFRLAIHQQR